MKTTGLLYTFNYLVFPKSANSNFRAFLLAPVTRNILGYSLFCDRSQDGVSFRDIFGRRNFVRQIKQSHKQISRKRRTWAFQCSLVGKKLFSC